MKDLKRDTDHNCLDQVAGVKEMSELWGLSESHIKHLCQQKKIIAKNIGRTWIVFKNQPNPSKYETK